MRKSRHRPTPPPARSTRTQPKTRPPAGIHELSRDTLRTRLRQIEKQLREVSTHDALITKEQEELKDQAEKIREELQQRHHFNRRIFFISVGILSVATLGFILFVLDNKANLAQTNLEHALITDNPQIIHTELERAKKGLNPYINPSLIRAIKEAQAHLKTLETRQSDAAAILSSLKNGTRPWESLSIADIRTLNSASFQHSPEGLAILGQWDALAKKRKAQNISLRSESLQKIMRPLPARATLDGSLSQNLYAVRQEMEELGERLEEFQLLRRIHRLNHEHATGMRARLQELRFLKRDIKALIKLEESLYDIESYEDFTFLLRSYRPQTYKLGSLISDLADKLPRESNLRDFIGRQQVKLTAAELQSLQLHLSGKSPTFNIHHPANMIQVNIMENIFQSSPLQGTYYQLYNPETNETWLITSEPTLNKDKKIQVELDELDPRALAGAEKKQLIQPSPRIQFKKLHYAHALKDLHMNREDFFISTNLVKSLENILRYKTGSISALYRAHLYQSLVEVVMAHSKPMQVGLPFSQQLRRDIKSFMLLEEKTGIQLRDTSWLETSARHKHAEKLYAQWFSERIGRQYLAEMSLMLRHYLHNTPDFVGFITSTGEPHFYTEVSAEDRLWFIDSYDMQLKVGDSEALVEAHSFSPLFRANMKNKP